MHLSGHLFATSNFCYMDTDVPIIWSATVADAIICRPGAIIWRPSAIIWRPGPIIWRPGPIIWRPES